MKAGLRAKLLLPSIAIVIVCMSLASFYSAKKASDELWRELLSSSRHLSQGVANNLGMFVEDIQGAVVMQAKNERIQRVFRDKSPEMLNDASQALTDLTKFDPSVQGASLLDPKGDVLASSDPSGSGNFSDRDYFKQAVNGHPNGATHGRVNGASGRCDLLGSCSVVL
jgi:methyl-accepting chemotaxis protein